MAKRLSQGELPGGMKETTLNSTITELAPAIGFINGFKITGSSLEDKISSFYSQLMNVDHQSLVGKVYLSAEDKKAGQDYIKTFPNSTKYAIKMENAIAILEELKHQNTMNPIEKVYWGYRAKPEGVGSKHKGDLFVVLKEPKKIPEIDRMLGVSLKAGGEKTKEPGLNTYVQQILLQVLPNGEKEILNLRKKLWKDIYYKFAPQIKNGDKMDEKYDVGAVRKTTKTALLKYEKKSNKAYEADYDYMLETCRKTVIKAFNTDVEATKNYIKKNVAKPIDIPGLIVLKAIGDRTEIKTDMDAVSVFLPRTISIEARASATSKQDFFIDMIAKNNDKLSLKFAIRSNKGTLDHKLQQFFNLAVKFNGTV